MTTEIKPPRKLMWLTLFVMALLIVATGVTHRSKIPEGISIDTKDQPTIGFAKAPVHVVVFEEPKCINCKDYSLEIYPELKEKFINTKKVRYTMIPVSFLPDSMPAAVAMLSVYKTDPESPNSELFFKYTDTLYQKQGDENSDWVNIELLLSIAKETSPAINLTALKNEILLETERKQIERNTLYGQKLMGGVISTPAVYVNGVEVKDLTLENLSTLISTFLNQDGVY